MKKIIALVFVLFEVSLHAQIGIGTTTPNAAIEVSSSTDGFLLPRVELTSKDTSKPILTPTVSEIVYNTATSGVAPNDVRPGFYFWAGTSWMELDNASDTKNWRSTGNNSITAATDFIGTTDNVDFNFRRFNIKSGTLSIANTAFGSGSLLVNTAIGNTTFGANALSANTTATGNMAFGYGALQDNAVFNTFTSGNADNTAFGLEALRFNNAGPDFYATSRARGNTAIGPRTLRANIRGYSNTAVGPNALNKNTLGQLNTAIGSETLASSTEISNNVALGSEVLRYNTGGGDNVILGKMAGGSVTTSFDNAVAGSNALPKATNGGKSTAFGYKALLENVFGSEHTVAGALAMEHANFSNRSTFIGYRSWAALPSISPTPPLEGSNNVGIGQSLAHSNSSSFNTGIGNGAEVPFNKGYQVRIGNTAITYAGVQVPWTITSDRRWKSNIESSNLGLAFIKELNPVSYIRKNDENKKLEYGFIAQELNQALTESKVANNAIVSKADDGMLSVRYNDLLAPMVKAIQQQQTIIDKLITRIKELEKNRVKK